MLRKLQQSIAGGAVIVGLASIVSRLFGLFRDRLLAGTFDASQELDIYLTAFKLPDFIFNILVLGALSSAFIPLFISEQQKDAQEKKGKGKEVGDHAWAFTNNVLHVLMFPLLILTVLVFILAPEVMQLLAPGFDLQQRIAAADLTRVMLLSVFFFFLSNLASGVLNATRHFVAFAVAPIFYNVGIIFGIVVFVPWMGLQGLAWGVVLGSGLHLLIQLPRMVRLGYHYRWVLDLGQASLRRMGRMMIPRTLSLGITQLNLLINVTLGSLLTAGSISVYHFANNLQFFPISAFGISLAISSFPAFSEAFADNNLAKFKEHFSMTVRRILFLIIPTSLAFLLLRAQIVRIVYGTENFSWEATYLTAQTLGIFSISMVAQGLLPLLARTFYAQHDTHTPFLISVIGLLVNIILALFFLTPWGVFGLAIAFSVSSVVQMLLLLVFLRSKLGDIDEGGISEGVLRIVCASLVMALGIHGGKYLMAELVDMQTFLGIFLQGTVALGLGAVIYLGIAMHFNFEEVELMRARWLRLKAALLLSLKRTSR